MNSHEIKTRRGKDSEAESHGGGGRSGVKRVLNFFNFSWISFFVTLTVFWIPFAGLIYILDFLDAKQQLWANSLYLLGIAGLYLISLLVSKLAVRLWQRVNIEKDISDLYDQLGKKDFFTTLIKINFKYIDKYYLQTQVQADKSFYLAAIAASLSLIMIVLGIIMLFAGGTNVTSAYVTMSAGILGEFIATVFFYLYNRTVSEMSNYHQKLVLTQNISLALRIADGLDDTVAKAKAQALLIESLSKDINMYLTMHANTTASNGIPKAKKRIVRKQGAGPATS